MEGCAVTEEEVEEFLTALRAADVDKKVNLIQLWGLKLEQVFELPARAIDGITLSVGPFVRSPSQLLVTSTLSSFLPFFIPLLPISPQTHLNLAILHLLPALVERLNDPKEKVHAPARDGIQSLGVKTYQSAALQHSIDGHLSKGKDKDNLVSQWETSVKDALGGRGTRCKLEGLKMLVQLRLEEDTKLPLKPWLPALVNLLEDSDGTVRDHAREAVVTLLSPANTPPAARSELKKLMVARNVRKSISDGILARVMGGGSNGTTTATARSVGATGSASETSQLDDHVEIVYIADARDLESEFRAMGPHFIGKETEHNWVHREQSMLRVRGMLRGGVFEAVPEAFLQGLKVVVIDGVCKTLLSLRTTLAQQSCILVQELADHLGPSLDPFGDQLLMVLGKMAGFTKRLIAERSQNAVTAIIKRTTLNSRVVIGHIQTAINDKSVQARQYGITHLRVFLATQAGHVVGAHDSTLSVNEVVDQLLRRALADTNAQVREQARLTFWALEAIDQRTAAAIIAGLDGPARKQLEKANPQQSKERIPPSTARSSLKPKTATSMSAMIAAKRAKAAAERAGTLAESGCHMPPRALESPAASISLVSEDRGPSDQDGLSGPPHTFISSSPSPHDNIRENPPRSMKLSGHDVSKNDFTFSDEMSSTSPQSQESKLESSSEVLSRSHDSPQCPGSKLGPDTQSKHRMCRAPHQHHRPIAPKTFCGQASSSGVKIPFSNDFVDPAEDARRAQAAQGLSAAKQLLEFDDDEIMIPTAPITPMRKCIPHPQATSKTPLNRMSAWQGWKDSPMPMTPKLIQTLESSGHERSWWNTRRKQSTISASDGQLSSIESDLKALNSPNPVVLQRIARFSACNVVKRNDSGIESSIWNQDNLFDRVLSGVLGLLDQQQVPAVLEHTLVAVWELLQNQWPLFDLREEMLLDHLFQLRTSSNAVVVESTNAMVSLLAALCDPPFLLLLLCSALERFLATHPDMTHRTAGYNLALNTMGMCILRLPQEAVELEATRISHHVVQSLDHDLGVVSRQAGNRVILAVQCMLQDDNRTLAAFPQLSASQRDFVTYQMEQAGLLRSGHESTMSVEALHHDLIDGLAKGSRTR